jgi:hypothetical protein
MKKRELKKTSNSFIQKILNKDLRILIIQAGFPYHKSPHLYQWLEFYDANETKQSRSRIMLIVDDTKSEKYGHCMEFIHKLFVVKKTVYYGL